MLLGAFPDAIAPGSDAAEVIVQEKYNPKLVSTLEWAASVPCMCPARA
jgi:hypothetical protein